MRIGIEAFRIFRKNKHGMDVVAIESIKKLQVLDKVNSYFIFCFNDSFNHEIFETENFRIIHIPKIPSPVAEQFLLPLLAIKYKLDLLHSTGNTSPLFLHCKRIITLHDVIYLESSKNYSGGTLYQRIGNRYRRFVVPYVIPKADKVITVSENEKEIIKNLFPNLKSEIQVIPNACAAHFTKKSAELSLGSSLKYNLPNLPYYLVHGNTDPKKNTENVLKAIHLLHKKGKLKRKLVITDISRFEIDKIIKRCELDGIQDLLCITNYVHNTDMPDLYSRAFLFLYPSKRESFGIPILESMACGTAVITSNCSSMPAISGDAALYADPNSPESIAACITKLETDKRLMAFLIKNGKQQLQNFNWTTSVSKLLNCYQSMKAEQVVSPKGTLLNKKGQPLLSS